MATSSGAFVAGNAAKSLADCSGPKHEHESTPPPVRAGPSPASTTGSPSPALTPVPKIDRSDTIMMLAQSSKTSLDALEYSPSTAYTLEETLPVPTDAGLPQPVAATLPNPAETPSPNPVKAPLPKPVEAPSPEPVEAPLAKPVETPSPKPLEAPLPKPVETPSPKPQEAPCSSEKPQEAAAPTPDPSAVPGVSKAGKGKGTGDGAVIQTKPSKTSPKKSQATPSPKKGTLFPAKKGFVPASALTPRAPAPPKTAEPKLEGYWRFNGIEFLVIA